MADIIHFPSKRTETAVSNPDDWSPLEALQDVMREVESGNIKPSALYIAIREEEDEDGCVGYPFVNFAKSGLLSDVISLLELHKFNLMVKGTGDDGDD